MATERFVARSTMPVAASELYEWHLRPGAFRRLLPPWERAEIEGAAVCPAEGARLTIRMPVGPFALRWVARHEKIEPGVGFVDFQESGPFRIWRHRHRFEPLDERRSSLVDDLEFAPPFAPFGNWFGGGAIRRKLERMFCYRHAITRSDLELHGSLAAPARTVAVTGSSGLVGSALVALLGTGGHRVVRLVRREPRPGSDEILFDPAGQRVDAASLEGLDAVVHLAGESVAGGRWTAERRRRIHDSRVDGTRLLCEALAGLDRPPEALIQASAIGFYGDRGDETLSEESPAGEGFLPEVCRQWEAAAEPAERAGLRVAQMRIGVVLTPAGGALQKMLTPFRLGLGGPVGDGRQFMSWIHHDDLVRLLFRAVFDPAYRGVINAVAPTPVAQRDFARSLAGVLGRPALAPMPAFAVRALFGQMGQDLLLASTRVVPDALERVGFRFLHAELEPALRHLLGRFDAESPRPEFETGRQAGAGSR